MLAGPEVFNKLLQLGFNYNFLSFEKNVRINNGMTSLLNRKVSVNAICSSATSHADLWLKGAAPLPPHDK